MTAPYTMTLIGCGKMGGAMLRSWLDNDLIGHVNIIKPSPPSEEFLTDNRVFHTTSSMDHIIEDDLLVLATKPQTLKDACENLAQNISQKTAVLSIAAGQSLTNIESLFSEQQPIIRVMPNTPAAIGKGMNIATANSATTQDQMRITTDLLNACGICQWIEDEGLMDAVTALSGSGPAYVFYLIEMMAKSGEEIGLPPEMAQTLARQTVIGSAALAEHSPETSASDLRVNVTSPGGTTQAALEVLMDGRMQEIMHEALNAAKKRSIDLNS